MCEAQEALHKKRMLDVSVVTPTYNRASLLSRVWGSLRSQTPVFEWIVVDDGSTDRTQEAIQQLCDPRIVYHRFPCNSGVNAARNVGAKLAKGRYVIFLDSDDELYPGAMARMAGIMDSSGPSIGAAMFTCLVDRLQGVVKDAPRQHIINKGEFVIHGITSDMILIYRKEVLERFSLPEDLRGCESLFLCDISRAYKFLVVPEPGSIIHRQGDNLSNANNLVERSRDIAILYERILSNNEDILRGHPRKIVEYLIKVMYRYGVAGDRISSLKTYLRILRRRSSFLALLKATGVLVLCFLGAARFERWRIDRLNRRLEV